MNANASKTASDPDNPEKRPRRTHRKERTVRHRKNRRARVLISAWRNRGDAKARDRVYEDHLHIAEFYARKYGGRGVDYDDLLQEAGLGLLEAIDRYDSAHKAAFGTFASCTVEGRIKQYFRDKAWPCSVPRNVKSLALQVRNMERILGRMPTRQEVIDAGVIPADKADAALMASQAWSSANLGQDGAGGLPPCGAQALSYIDPKYELTANLLDMEAAMRKLGEDEMRIALLYYFGHLTQKEIARQTGASPDSVSRTLRKATRKLGQDFAAMYRAS